MRKFKPAAITIALIILTAANCSAQWRVPRDKSKGFLDRPPLYINNEPDFPLTIMDIALPPAGILVPNLDVSGIRSDEFRKDGVNVQPNLDLEINWIRGEALRGFGQGWAAAISIPWYRNKVKGMIGGEPATAIAEGFGNIALVGKKQIWHGQDNRRAVLAAGFEVPSGKNNSVFNQSNAVTNAYWRNSPQRLPLGWQPSTGTFNGLLAGSYGGAEGRFSYEGFLATKLFTPDDEDVKVGNILIFTATGTYGISRTLAGSLGLTLRSQSDDSYPEAPPPGVNQPALAGTTNHGTTLYLDTSIRYILLNRLTVGVGVRVPVMKPEDGMVPTGQLSVIFYPNL